MPENTQSQGESAKNGSANRLDTLVDLILVTEPEFYHFADIKFTAQGESLKSVGKIFFTGSKIIEAAGKQQWQML